MEPEEPATHGFAIAIFVMFGVVVFTVFGYFFLLPDIAPKQISIAVMPFKAETDGDRMRLDGLAEDLVAGLARSRELLVVDFRASLDVERLGTLSRGYLNELGATHVVDGKLECEAEVCVLDARLVDVAAPAPKQVWQHAFEDVWTDPIAVRDAVTRGVRLAVYDEGSDLSMAGPRSDAGAYEKFLMARYALFHGDRVGAAALARESVAMEANPYALTLLAELDARAARKHVRQALAIDDDYLAARILDTRLDFAETHDLNTYYERLVGLTTDYPNSSALPLLAEVYVALGWHADAVVLLERLARMRPRSYEVAVQLALLQYRQGDARAASRSLEIAMLRGDEAARWRWLYQLETGTADQAGAVDEALQLRWLAATDAADRGLSSRIVDMDGDEQVEVALHLGDLDAAFGALGAARTWWTEPPPWWRADDPRWRRFVDDRRYADYLREIGFEPHKVAELEPRSAAAMLAPRRPD